MRKYPAGAPATGRIVNTPNISGARAAWLLLVVASLTVVAVLIAAGDAQAAPTPLRLGTPAATHHVIPGVMAPWSTYPVDLDGDTFQELVVSSGDGVLQKYDENGRYVWGIDTQTLATDLGVLSENAGHFIGPRKHMLPTTETGIVFLDVNADGVLDIITASYLAVDEPTNALRSALVQVDGKSGAIIDIRLKPGFIHHIIEGNFDTDPGRELLIVEENGARHLNAAGTHWIGTNGTTRIYVEDLDGTPGWTHDTGRGWAQVTAIVRAKLDSTAPDVAFAVTDAFPTFIQDLDKRNEPFAQDLVALDGTLGTTLWTVPTLDYVREIVRAQNSGGTFDLILGIQEPQAVSTLSRGDARAQVTFVKGLDGSTVWTNAKEMGNLPTLHDIDVRPDAVPTVAFAYTTESTSPYDGEQAVQFEIRKITDGTSISTTRLAGSEIEEVTLLGGLLSLIGADYPAPLTTEPTITGMRFVQTDLDGDTLADFVIANDRGLHGVLVQGTTLAPLWHTPATTDPDIFFKVNAPGATEVWTQDIHSARLSSFRALDGSHIKDTPLVSMFLGVTRADIDADGDIDRVAGGTSGTLFAFDAATDTLLWQRTVGKHVLDVKGADVNGDAKPDILWIGDREAGAVSSTGAVLWKHRHIFADDGGEYRDWKYADLTQDGVPDLVISYRSGSNGGTGPTRLAQVFALDGKTGMQLWAHTLPPPIWAANGLDVRDMDLDGVPDVAFTTQTAANAVYYGVGVLNGANGLLKWRVDLTVPGGQNVLDANSVVIVDADGDTDMDVVVATRGGGTFAAALRAHDGQTGLLIWEKKVDTSSDLTNEGIHRGMIGAAGGESILVHSKDNGAGAQRLTALTPRGGLLYKQSYPDLLIITDVRFGDVDGDGIDDVVLASPQGLVVLDSGATLGENPRHLGHVTTWAPSKVRLFEVDNDGKMEMEFLSHPQNWPIQVGPLRLTDLGRGKAVGTADMDAFVPPPLNRSPNADFVVLTNPIVQGENTTLLSTSYDPDGTIVSERWVFPDGTELTGNQVTFMFNLSGPQKVKLLAMDNFGKLGGIEKTLDVRPVYGFTVKQDRTGTRGAPDTSFTYRFTVNNTGVKADNFTVALASKPGDWNVTLETTGFPLQPGAKRTVNVTVDVNSAIPLADLQFKVHSVTGNETKTHQHRVLVAIEMHSLLYGGAGPYSPIGDIGGFARLQWSDGTPLENHTVRVSFPGTVQPDLELTTDSDGQVIFLVTKDLMVAHSPGSREVIVQPELPGYTTSKTLRYTVAVGALGL